MTISIQAKKDLKEALQKHIGLDADVFSDEDLNEIGIFLLTVLAENLKIKAIILHSN